MPKVLSIPFRAQDVILLALPSSEDEQGPNSLYPFLALRVHVEHSSHFQQSDQLFVSFRGCSKGLPVTKQRLSNWIVEAIALAYASVGLQCPIRVRAHFTKGMASSWAWSSEVSIGDICAAAG